MRPFRYPLFTAVGVGVEAGILYASPSVFTVALTATTFSMWVTALVAAAIMAHSDGKLARLKLLQEERKDTMRAMKEHQAAMLDALDGQ